MGQDAHERSPLFFHMAITTFLETWDRVPLGVHRDHASRGPNVGAWSYVQLEAARPGPPDPRDPAIARVLEAWADWDGEPREIERLVDDYGRALEDLFLEWARHRGDELGPACAMLLRHEARESAGLFGEIARDYGAEAAIPSDVEALRRALLSSTGPLVAPVRRIVETWDRWRTWREPRSQAELRRVLGDAVEALRAAHLAQAAVGGRPSTTALVTRALAIHERMFREDQARWQSARSPSPRDRAREAVRAFLLEETDARAAAMEQALAAIAAEA